MANPKDFGLEDDELEPEVLEHFVWVDTELSVFHPAMPKTETPKEKTPENAGKIETPAVEGLPPASLLPVMPENEAPHMGKGARNYQFIEICAWLRLTPAEKEILTLAFDITHDRIFTADSVREMEDMLEIREIYQETGAFPPNSPDMWRVCLFAESMTEMIAEEFQNEPEAKNAGAPNLEYIADYIFGDSEPIFDLEAALPDETAEIMPNRLQFLQLIAVFITIRADRRPALREGSEISEALFTRALRIFTPSESV